MHPGVRHISLTSGFESTALVPVDGFALLRASVDNGRCDVGIGGTTHRCGTDVDADADAGAKKA